MTTAALPGFFGAESPLAGWFVVLAALLVGLAVGVATGALVAGRTVAAKSHVPGASAVSPPPRVKGSPKDADSSHAPGGEAVPAAGSDAKAASRAVAGTCYLVGGGLGDADLLTVRARSLIQTADVVLFDRLISEEIRRLAGPGADVHVARKVPGKADAAQAELNRLGVTALRAGRSVVRVKIGDPLLFARGGEEVCVYRAHGFEPVLVPGLSSALVAPLLAGIPVTHRGVANQLLVTTGRDKGGAFPDLPRYSPTRTIVILMAVGRMPTLFAEELGPRGYPASTPVAVIENASLPNERQTLTTLGTAAEDYERIGFKAPAVVVVGNVVTALRDAAVVSAATSLGPARAPVV